MFKNRQKVWIIPHNVWGTFLADHADIRRDPNTAERLLVYGVVCDSNDRLTGYYLMSELSAVDPTTLKPQREYRSGHVSLLCY